MSAGAVLPAVLVFDLGKVLLDFDYGIAATRLASRCALSAEQVRSVIDQSPLLFAYETGRLKSQGFYDEVCQRTGFRGVLDEFSASFSDIFTEIEPMVDLQRRLRKRGIPTWIFSNTNPIALAHIRRQFPFFEQFDGYVLSFEHGAMKPDPVIYERVEKATGRRGAEILYMDDRPENVEAGRARGWRVIHHVSPEQTIAAVERLKLL
jgi:FMN phosphatase YigB (HAD superfamily)